jgi:hypothetical protein
MVPVAYLLRLPPAEVSFDFFVTGLRPAFARRQARKRTTAACAAGVSVSEVCSPIEAIEVVWALKPWAWAPTIGLTSPPARPS